MNAWVICKRGFTTSHPNALLGEAPLFNSLDEIDLYQQDWVYLARYRCRHYMALRSYENRLPSEIGSARRCWGNNSEVVSHIFQKCLYLTRERVRLEVSNTRDHWNEAEIAPRFHETNGLSQVLIRRSIIGLQGYPTL